jgi:UDP-N-acetylglucosamine 1-carboxyvinyltransferase
MEVIRIVGGRRLEGEVAIPASKNAALALLSAVPLIQGPLVLSGLPRISDVRIKQNLLSLLGVKITEIGDETHFDASEASAVEPCEEMMRKIRTGFYLFGPLLARFGHAVLPMPGGCPIGDRPVDFHLKGLRAMGAEISIESGRYVGRVDRLKGTEIYLDFPSAGATQHLMATACLAEGVTTIQNAAIEPEVTQLADFLISMGARIEGAGSSNISIYGDGPLKGGWAKVPTDRIQAATYLLAGAITKGDVTVTGVLPEHQIALIQKLKEAEVIVDEGNDWVRVRSEGRAKAVKVKTMPYPGFPTDVQQPFAAFLALARGSSVVEETIYESRNGHVPELVRMGAQMRTNNRLTMIDGVHSLRGATVKATDLRAGAALILAGLAAEGETVVDNVHFIDRGYEGLIERLTSLDARVERVSSPQSSF